MLGRANTTAAPLRFEVDGKAYCMSPLKDRDFGEFELWLQDRCIDLARRNTEGLAPGDKEILRCAVDKAMKLTISSPEALDRMMTIDGASELLYLSLRAEHPDITYEEARRLCTRAEVLKVCMDRITMLNSPPKASASADPKKGPPKPVKKNRRRRRLSARSST